MNPEILSEYVRLDARKKALKRELEEVQAALNETEEMVLSGFEQDGVTMVRFNGSTVYVQRSVRVKLDPDVGREEAANNLASAGYGDLIKLDFNLNTVSGLFRELVRENGIDNVEVPRGFRLEEDVEARVRS